MTQKPQKSGWYRKLKARLIGVPKRVWFALLAVSFLVHLAAVGGVLVLLFGGERGGGAAHRWR